MQLLGTKIFRTISVIKIVASKKHHKQKISCHASNSQSKHSKSSETTLMLLYKPEVKVRQGSSGEGENAGDSLQFNCFSDSQPRVREVEWYLNDEKLPGETQDILMLSQADMAQPATVRCVVRNLIGSAEDQVTVQLRCK